MKKAHVKNFDCGTVINNYEYYIQNGCIYCINHNNHSTETYKLTNGEREWAEDIRNSYDKHDADMWYALNKLFDQHAIGYSDEHDNQFCLV